MLSRAGVFRRKEEDIMYEVMTQGPVQVLMQVFTGTVHHGQSFVKIHDDDL